jgi:hypothetical protein
MKKTLQVVTTGYRCNIEEQDDPVLWIAQAMKGAGAEMDVLLEGDAVNYGVHGQDASGLSFGERRQTQPPQIEEDVMRLLREGVAVFVVEDDATARGLERGDLVQGVQGVPRAALPGLFAGYEQVWRW